MKKIFFTFLALLVFIPSPSRAAFRDSPVKSAQESFQILDTNGDGQVAKDEGPIGLSWLPGRFELMDLNGDALLSYDEYLDWSESPRVQQQVDVLSTDIFAALDLDGDLRLGWDEWAGTKQAFEGWDRDHDGYIAYAETRVR